MKQLLSAVMLLTGMSILFTAEGQINNPPWSLLGSNTTFGQSLQNTPRNIRDFTIWQKDKSKMSIFRVDRPDAVLQDYTFFISPTNNDAYSFGYFGYSQGRAAAVHFQNNRGAGLVSYTTHDYDWGQNIISVVTRPNTASYVLNRNGSDLVYTMGSGYVAAKCGFWNFSDKNLKTDISTITDALTKVKALRGVTYRFNNETLCDSCDAETVLLSDDHSSQMGLIAQEVEQVVPEVVRDQHTGYKAVAYANLVGLLVEAIKDLDNRINACCGASYKSSQAENNLLNKNTESAVKKSTPPGYLLGQSVPNRTNSGMSIDYSTPSISCTSEIMVFDMQGKFIKSYDVAPGTSTLVINKGELPTGMYLYSLVIGGSEMDTKKMILTQ
jgi:Chaperone of endosialidase